MNDRELATRLRDRYRTRAAETEKAPLSLRLDVAAIPRTATVPRRSFGRGRGMTLLAAAVLIGGGALAAGTGILRLPAINPPVVADVSPRATATPVASAPVAPPSTPLSLELAWTNLPFEGDLGFVSASGDVFEFPPALAWVGDRFVLADVESGEVRTSTDGQDWEAVSADLAQAYLNLLRGSSASWEDRAIGWFNPEERPGPQVAGESPITARDVVQYVGPTGVPGATTPFKGRIESIGIGARGIVAQVHSHLDWDAWVTDKLGLRTNNDWTCCVRDVTFDDGVLEIKLSNRPGLKVVWADEGFAPGDYQDRGFGWYSPDGEQWTAMAPNEKPTPDSGSSLPTGGWGSVVGVSDGFIATGSSPDGACPPTAESCAGIWYSADGLTWRLLDTTTEVRLVPWRGGVLAIDGASHATFWTSAGREQLPMAASLYETVVTGPLGIVSIGDGQVLVSRNGTEYKVGALPAQMDQGVSAVAVGDRTVAVLVRTGTGEFTTTQSLWLGTLQP